MPSGCPNGREWGIYSWYDKKADRERILSEFKQGRIKTVFNVGVLTIGFDFPA